MGKTKGRNRLDEDGVRHYDPDRIAERLIEYTKEAKDPYPMIAEFCYKYDYEKSHLYDMAKKSSNLANAIKKMHGKAEFMAENLLTNGKMPPAFGIFKLKQPAFGWINKDTEDSNEKTTPTIIVNLNKNDE